MDMGLIRCQVCNKYMSSTKEGRAIHMKRYHGLKVQVDVPKLSPEEKARIVDRVERKLGLQHFIVPDPISIVKILQPSSTDPVIIPQYCGVNAESCVWEVHGFEICGPCGIRKAWEATQAPPPTEDIVYHD